MSLPFTGRERQTHDHHSLYRQGRKTMVTLPCTGGKGNLGFLSLPVHEDHGVTRQVRNRITKILLPFITRYLCMRTMFSFPNLSRNGYHGPIPSQYRNDNLDFLDRLGWKTMSPFP